MSSKFYNFMTRFSLDEQFILTLRKESEFSLTCDFYRLLINFGDLIVIHGQNQEKKDAIFLGSYESLRFNPSIVLLDEQGLCLVFKSDILRAKILERFE